MYVVHELSEYLLCNNNKACDLIYYYLLLN